MMKMKAGNWYKFNDRGQVAIGQYMGREDGFECCVCNKGCKARCFNIWYDRDGYETWGFGKEHMPEIIEDLGTSEQVIIGE